jgi:putative hydrolase of the HAD superfamily
MSPPGIVTCDAAARAEEVGAVTVAAVVFDWGGTLTPWHVFDQHQVWLAAAGQDAALASRLAEAETRLWVRSRDEHLAFGLDDVFRAAAFWPDPAGLSAYHAAWEEHTFTDPAVPGVLTALRERGLRVGVLSNTPWTRERHQSIFRRDGVAELIDGAVYTSELHHAKPHREAFAAALRAVGDPPPEHTVYVGDRLYDDVYGAQQAGLRAVYLPHSTIPDWQRGQVEGIPDATIEHLGDLLDVIDRWRRS